jgi:hypothetical protein
MLSPCVIFPTFPIPVPPTCGKHTKRKSIKGRRKIAGWDHDFLLHLIAG